MSFINKLKSLTSSSKSKSLNDFRKELKQRGKTNDEYIEKVMSDDVAFSLQAKGIEHYKNKEFDEAEKNLIQAMEGGFYSPGGLMFLAKIYRKKKYYASEVTLLETGLQRLKNDTENNYGQNLVKIEERLSKAKELNKALDK